MHLREWIYFFKQALINISNNRLIHLISISTISISMLIFGSFLLVSVNLHTWIKAWGGSLSMTVYLQDGIKDEVLKDVETKLRQINKAEVKEFISKEKAMMLLREALGTQSGLLDGLEKNPLPASYDIIFRNATADQIDPRKIKEDIEKIEGVDEVQYSEQWVERFEGMLYVFKVIGIIIGVFLCVAVLFITTNTIKLTIYSRKDEIEIYKLVGATDWFVKIPFLIEGSIQGIIGGVIAFVVLFLGYSVFSLKSIHVFGLPVLDIVFLPGDYLLLIILLSLALGFIGAFIAVGRFFEN
ncbi:MAG: ABC transporter permease [Deltaproteobacteria bacterium]|nr:ABC transporter permease [Deltaproteobacteria bacterium]